MEAEEPVWQALCAAEFCVEGPPAGPDRGTLPSYRAAYRAWRLSFGKYGQLATRALRAWAQVEAWMSAHLPVVAASLRCG